MNNVEQHAHGMGHEVHIQCKRSLSTLVFSLLFLMITDNKKVP